MVDGTHIGLYHGCCVSDPKHPHMKKAPYPHQPKQDKEPSQKPHQGGFVYTKYTRAARQMQ